VVWQPRDQAEAPLPRHPLGEVVNETGRPIERIVSCGACGGAVDQKSSGLCCRSCGAALVRDSDLSEPVRPDGLLPFAIDEDAARAAFTRWIAHRWFAPGTLKGSARISSVDGVFLPFWSFSTATFSSYVGRRGETSQRQVMRTTTDADGRPQTHWETETETHWHRVSGEVSHYFDGLMTSACSPLAEKIPRWPLAGLRPYRQGSAAGKRIIAYDVVPEDAFELAKELMREQIERDVRADIGGTAQSVNDVATRFTDESCTLLLLPAWLVSYSHRGRTWSALVNGTSGEVAGERPYSGAKVSLLIGTLAVAIAVAVLLLQR
jgi:hypothetical protein